MKKLFRFGAVGNVSFIILISRLSGYIRDMCVAAFIGAGPLGDALMAAFKLTNLFRAIFSEGAMNAALVPAISQSITTHGSNYARVVASHVFSTLLIILILFTGFIFYQMENFIMITNPGFISNTYIFHLTIELSYIMFPYLTFISAAAFYGAILQTKKVFVPYAATSIILNTTLITLLYINNSFIAYSSVHIFAYGLLTSGILELSWMIWCSRKYNAQLYLRRPIMSRYVKIILKRILPGIFGAGIIQISVWCDMLILSFYTGGISYLYFADRIVQLPLAIFSTSQAIVLLQSLSKPDTISNKKYIIFNRTLRTMLGFIIPSAAGIFIISEEVIQVLFMRGAFNNEATTHTSTILQILSIALPFQAISKLYCTAINATGNTSTPVKFSFISLLLNVGLSLMLMSFIEFKSVAVATIISSVCQTIMLILYSEKQSNNCNLSYETKKDILKYIVASIIMTIVLYYFKSSNVSLIELFKYVILGIISYSISLFIMRAEFINDLLQRNEKI